MLAPHVSFTDPDYSTDIIVKQADEIAHNYVQAIGAFKNIRRFTTVPDFDPHKASYDFVNVLLTVLLV